MASPLPALAPPLLHQDLRLPDERVRLRPDGGRAARRRGSGGHRRPTRGGPAAHEYLLGAREGAGEGVLAARGVAGAERAPAARGHPRPPPPGGARKAPAPPSGARSGARGSAHKPAPPPPAW